MIKLFTILTLFFFKVNAQSYTLTWSSAGHTKYVIQQSTDNKTWSTTTTLTANVTDTAFTFILPLPVKFNYYKVIADTYSSQSIYVNNISPISTINPSSTHIKLRSQ